MYSNRVYIAEVDASHFVEVSRTEKVDKWFSLKQCPLVYTGIGCVDIRRTAGNIRIRRLEYRYVFKEWRARRRYRELTMFARRINLVSLAFCLYFLHNRK
jgi:hypothetical protein